MSKPVDYGLIKRSEQSSSLIFLDDNKRDVVGLRHTLSDFVNAF